MNNDYTRLTYQQLLDDFSNRLKNDERFKNISNASIYNMFMEMLTTTMDMTNFYIERTAEEAFIDTARLESSIIKHGKNLGYNPIRNTPAEAEIAIQIKGPLPQSLKPGATVYFSQEQTDLTFNKLKYKLDKDYSYTFTAEDIKDGQSSTWVKTLYMSREHESMKYLELQGMKLYSNGSLKPIKVFQGELIEKEILATANLKKIGRTYQFYDIDDLKFSNWYGQRDPNGWYKNKYYSKNSWCKVGIGVDKDVALSDAHVYTIEDNSIYLNDDVRNYEDTDFNEPLHVCSITTNGDKSVRLRFGDGVIVNNGFNQENEKIWIQYIACEGAKANRVGTSGAQLQISNKFYGTQSGSIVDITPNIKFLLNSDIVGGVDFESTQSIKNHAPQYYASNNRLITKNDFVSYFNNLTVPIRVKNAIAWGQDEIEDFDNNGYQTFKYLQNIVCYCIAASLYNIDGDVCGVVNVLTNSDENQNGTFSVYGTANTYLEHLTDFLKMILSYDSFNQVQYSENPAQQWIKNVKMIRENAEPRMIVNSKIFSLPPIVHYYDVVGTVEIDSLAKMQQYKTECEKDIYTWLDTNTDFCKKIYLSDITKFFSKRNETKGINLNIRVSDIIKNKNIQYVFNMSNKSIDMIYSYNPNSPGSDRSHIPEGQIPYNTITIPKIDTKGNTITADMFKNRSLELKFYTCNAGGTYYSDKLPIQLTPYDVSESKNNIIITMYGVESYSPGDIGIGTQSLLYLSLSSTEDFYSTSNFGTSNSQAYNLTSNQVRGIQTMLKNWINNATVVTEADRPIPLPYYITTMDVDTRAETIKRLGTIQNSYETQLTEKAFWMYMVPLIIKTYYHNSILDFSDEDVDGDTWSYIDLLVSDIYAQFKATLCDSVLDDNNNIVNFSMDNEIPVVRLNITYKYRN